MEPVSPDTVFAREPGIDSVGRRGGGKPGVEGGIEDRHLGQPGHRGAGGFNPRDGTRVVQRCQHPQIPDPAHHVVVDQGGLSKQGTAMDHTVSNRVKRRFVDAKLGEHLT